MRKQKVATGCDRTERVPTKKREKYLETSYLPGTLQFQCRCQGSGCIVYELGVVGWPFQWGGLCIYCETCIFVYASRLILIARSFWRQTQERILWTNRSVLVNLNSVTPMSDATIAQRYDRASLLDVTRWNVNERKSISLTLCIGNTSASGSITWYVSVDGIQTV